MPNQVKDILSLAAKAAVALPRLWMSRRGLRIAAQHNVKIFLDGIKAAEHFLRILTGLKRRHKGFDLDWELAASSFFAASLSMDLNTAVLISAGTWNRHKRDFLSRTIAVTLHEGLTQYMKYVMPALFKFLNKRIDSPELLKRHKLCAKRFAQLERDCGSYLYTIRNNCMAHRETNYTAFSQVRGSVDENRLMNHLGEFYMIQTEATQISGAAMQQATENIKTKGVEY